MAIRGEQDKRGCCAAAGKWPQSSFPTATPHFKVLQLPISKASTRLIRWHSQMPHAGRTDNWPCSRESPKEKHWCLIDPQCSLFEPSLTSSCPLWVQFPTIRDKTGRQANQKEDYQDQYRPNSRRKGEQSDVSRDHSEKNDGQSCRLQRCDQRGESRRTDLE